MAISIVTMVGDNYGSALQNYALQQAIQECGADSKTICVRPKSKLLQFFRSYVFASSWSEFLRKQWKLYSDIANHSKRKKVSDFFEERIALTKYKSISELTQREKSTTTFIAGSDQIWNPAFQPSRLYYLQFAEQTSGRCYSYAVSLAVDRLSSQEERYYQQAIQGRFDCVSVRERTGANLLKGILQGMDIREDVDPVLLWIPSGGWASLASNRFCGKKYVLLYMLRPLKDLVEFALKVGRDLGRPVIYLGDYVFKANGMKFVGDAGVEDFLSAIMNAEVVITNSFHATLFSILFKKPFYTVAVTKTGSRVTDFLTSVGLQDRIITNDTTNVKNYVPDYDEAIASIEQRAALSREYIRYIVVKERN